HHVLLLANRLHSSPSLIFVYSSRSHRDLHSFPTRRSSDLPVHQHGCSAGCESNRDDQFHQQWHALAGARNNRPDRVCDTEGVPRSEEHTSELQSRGHLVCRLLLEKKKNTKDTITQATSADT